ncbi:DNA mismatch repair pms2 [Fusarium longipes]|uniref:DNA mismatch repair protein PMS1 n=1 Tax=Fusarium longipes TaxID=694270 RepID=A0A395S7C5_9HYPO|nr:DNA mismatch repair pms2 [Fusarium longipes]
MATIKQIDGRTVHQIQSGQVIVDLCSVVKELVENSVDAGATSIDVRFKNQGLDLIEVADNGSGISPDNYPSVALKHHTSKLSSYSDIATLETFGFRGEALASLCALSTVSVTTCQQGEAPKGTKLSFEPSGKLSGTAVVAASKGTTVSVERLFHNLPVRRRELERNIKREWNKVIALLGQYACIQTNMKFSVSQQPTKGKRIHMFSTKGNPTTRENIINIFGAKTMTVLVPLDLCLEMHPSSVNPALRVDSDNEHTSKEVRIVGHVSRPSNGDGRQTPDRQMFFVNGRPCGLPQFAKAFNEVYKSYNNTQTPFILADIQLDTHMYDVNVSPDKRSILLHDQNQLLDNLRTSLTDLFDSQDYAVPTSQLMPFKSRTETTPNINTPFKPLHATPIKTPVTSNSNNGSDDEVSSEEMPISRVPSGAARRVGGSRSLERNVSSQNLISGWVERKSTKRPESRDYQVSNMESSTPSVTRGEPSLFVRSPSPSSEIDENDLDKPLPVRDFNKQLRANSLIKDGPSAIPTSPSILAEKGPHIPATTPLRRGQHEATYISPIKTSRNRTIPETTVMIGDEILEKVANSTDDEDGQADVATDEDMDVDDPEPSFGSRLTQQYAAGSKTTNTEKFSSKQSGAKVPDNPMTSESDVAGSDSDTSVYDAERDNNVASEVTLPPPGDQTAEVPEAQSVSSDSPPSPVPDKSVTTDHKNQASKSSTRKKESTAQLLQNVRTNETLIQSDMKCWVNGLPSNGDSHASEDEVTDLAAANAEDKLSLTIARKDFLRMRIAGQFNMGFIIASRPASTRSGEELEAADNDELFIIDQHATDEKYNFERLQEIQTVQSQRLVHPKRLELTALEEEIVLQNIPAIEANGFKVHVDMSGDEPVGSRCEVLALPMSREVTFSLADFEELIALLGEESSESKHIPRPSKVRKMFASRACRSSVMIGKALTHGQMETLVRHMAELDKPWNCPHGRPTMRHLCQLDSWDSKGWEDDNPQTSSVSWQAYLKGK